MGAPAEGDLSKRTINQIIRSSKIVAAVGLSPRPNRPNHGVAAYFQRQGYQIVPVNPAVESVPGDRSYSTLGDIPFAVDIADVVRQPSAVPAIARDAVKIGAKTLWLLVGVVSAEGAEIARRGGLRVVMDRCLMVDHRTLSRRR